MKRSLVSALLLAVAWFWLFCPRPSSQAQHTNAPSAKIFAHLPIVAEMMAQVQAAELYTDLAQLSGKAPVMVGGTPYTFTTRYTGSGEPIDKATQYVYERLHSRGLDVSYHEWSGCSTSGRNVIGVMTGTLAPDEIVLITAHLDDKPALGRAPGADDNGSGSIAVVTTAEVLRRYRFSRTLRFVLFTGEEQGLCGSTAYANVVSAAGENIVAVVNLDMIAWDEAGDPILRLHTRKTTDPGYAADLAIAGVFTNVVDTYSYTSALIPVITPDGESASDHSRFWAKGYPALLTIEDDYDDFNPHYHTSDDTVAQINLAYFTNVVKISVGTAAHLSQPIFQIFLPHATR